MSSVRNVKRMRNERQLRGFRHGHRAVEQLDKGSKEEYRERGERDGDAEESEDHRSDIVFGSTAVLTNSPSTPQQSYCVNISTVV